MTLKLEITRLAPLFSRGNFIQWDLQGAATPGAYVFDVYRGGSAEGPWEPLVVGAINTYHYLDLLSFEEPPPGTQLPHQFALSRLFYYRVVVTPPTGTVDRVEAVSPVEPKLMGVQRRLRRKFLRDASLTGRLRGTEVAVCKRVRWGARCSVCYDQASRAVIRSSCPTCHGIGFVPGYHNPVVTKAHRNVTTVDTQVTVQGRTDVVQTRITMLDVPQVQDQDLLVFLRDNRRFLVQKVAPTELQTTTVHQRVFVSEIARSSPEYRIPVDPVTQLF